MISPRHSALNIPTRTNSIVTACLRYDVIWGWWEYACYMLSSAEWWMRANTGYETSATCFFARLAKLNQRLIASGIIIRSCYTHGALRKTCSVRNCRPAYVWCSGWMSFFLFSIQISSFIFQVYHTRITQKQVCPRFLSVYIFGFIILILWLWRFGSVVLRFITVFTIFFFSFLLPQIRSVLIINWTSWYYQHFLHSRSVILLRFIVDWANVFSSCSISVSSRYCNLLRQFLRVCLRVMCVLFSSCCLVKYRK